MSRFATGAWWDIFDGFEESRGGAGRLRDMARDGAGEAGDANEKNGGRG